jgi:ankyrin repeat protein
MGDQTKVQELYRASRAGDVEGVAKIVAENPALAIFAAVIQGDVAAVEALLTANRSLVSAVSPDGWTPLHLAAHFAKKDVVRLLLNKGAQVNAKSTNQMQNMPLHAAAAGKAVEVAKLLVIHGANVNARQHGGWTALHAAAQNGDVDFARVLLDHGADVNVRADNHQRPLDLALTKGQQAMVEFLETNGAAL